MTMSEDGQTPLSPDKVANASENLIFMRGEIAEIAPRFGSVPIIVECGKPVCPVIELTPASAIFKLDCIFRR